MDKDTLIAVGLTSAQAAAYALLIERGEVKPPMAATHLKTTRTNAYKLLDKLVELGLAQKNESGKKLIYSPANPLALTSLSAQYRAEAVAREEVVNSIMHDLLAKYYEHTDKPHLEVATGQKAVAAAYRKQLNLREDIFFIHTKADVPIMGFDTMHEIRVAPSQHGLKRNGILGAPDKGPINYENHKRSNLDITWIDRKSYDAPVEWSVTPSSLLIVLYATEPHAILIADKVVAGAFLQLFTLLSSLLRHQPTHQKFAHNSKSKD
jgi:predicted transcriptional regulator